jgi:hypothetical protein
VREPALELGRNKASDAGTACSVDEADLRGTSEGRDDEVDALEGKAQSGGVVVVDGDNLAFVLLFKIGTRLRWHHQWGDQTIKAAGGRLTVLDSTMTGFEVRQRWWARRSANVPAPAIAILIMTRTNAGEGLFEIDVARYWAAVQRSSRRPVVGGRV